MNRVKTQRTDFKKNRNCRHKMFVTIILLFCFFFILLTVMQERRASHNIKNVVKTREDSSAQRVLVLFLILGFSPFF